MLAKVESIPTPALAKTSSDAEKAKKRKQGRPKTPIEKRLWDKVEQKGKTECWPWLGATTSAGYGLIWLSDGKVSTVHREIFRQRKGGIPKGKLILHRCHNRKCCNPDHLKSGTQSENMADMVMSGRNSKVRVLNDSQVLEIVKIRTERKLPYKTIGLMFGVSGSNVSLICRGKTYSWLTGIGVNADQRKAA